jgi:hypothetical protein
MITPAIKRMDVEDFLAWADNQENGRYELIRGQIVAWHRNELSMRWRRVANALESTAGMASTSRHGVGLARLRDAANNILGELVPELGDARDRLD